MRAKRKDLGARGKNSALAGILASAAQILRETFGGVL
jgi:hypothetical protein